MSVKDIDKGMTAIFRELRVFEDHDVYIGFIEGEKDTRSSDEVGGRQFINNATLAAVHEYGSSDGTIPPRLALREFVDAKREEIGQQMDRAFDNMVRGRKGMVQLNRIGAWAVARHRRYVRDVQPGPPLSAATLKAKAPKTKSMIDTGQLLNAETWVVRKSKS